MRTTISIDDAVLEEAKAIAAQTGKSLGAVVEDALREAIAKRATAPMRPRVKLPVFGRPGHVMPGVDLDSNAALLDFMEEDDD
ncbi:MAG: DUF6364 family protein [Chloroflexi bacterium]|nr:DUF6364 family protein [Chloroflexota bacterium]MDA1240068.1 DUF6364 family protein [Chloroflexota bacterium]